MYNQKDLITFYKTLHIIHSQLFNNIPSSKVFSTQRLIKNDLVPATQFIGLFIKILLDDTGEWKYALVHM